MLAASETLVSNTLMVIPILKPDPYMKKQDSEMKKLMPTNRIKKMEASRVNLFFQSKLLKIINDTNMIPYSKKFLKESVTSLLAEILLTIYGKDRVKPMM